MLASDANSTRRTILTFGAATAAVAGFGALTRFLKPAKAETIVSKPGKVRIEKFDDSGRNLGAFMADKVVKTEADWRKQLSELAFVVTRQEGTERAFTGPYWDSHGAGLYRCVCCDNAVYSSDAKYDSGTGWPSFWQPVAKENIYETEDTTFGMVRTALSCTLCDAHLGHVFNDGPAPTGMRHCINGVALRFVERPAA